MNWEQQVTDEIFGGNKDRFKTAQAHLIRESNMHVIRWSDLQSSVTILPDFETDILNLIEHRLGYLPHKSVTLPYELYLRGLLNAYNQGSITANDYIQQADDHIKLIRNEDMKHNVCPTYDEVIYQKYQKYFFPYGQMAKMRITKFLGYEPELKSSIIAEMWMRDILAKDTFKLPDQITSVDWKALTLVKYREALLSLNKAAADLSPLIKHNDL